MDVAFISHFSAGRRVIDVVDAGVAVALCPGDGDPVEETYCQRIVDGTLSEVVPDVSDDPVARAVPVGQDLGVRAHVGVPIVLEDGLVVGTLCTYAHAPRPDLDERAATVLGVVADAIAHSIASDRNAWQSREDIRRRIDGLLAEDRLEMAYQPLFCLKTGALVATEALARFPADLGGDPSSWFAEAAAVGQSSRLELAAVRAAVAALPHLPETAALHVNLSPAVLVQVSEQLASELPLQRMVIEITEHHAIDDYDELARALSPLRDAGAKVAIDDAGAGFASFRHALLLAPEILKLDSSLVRDIDTDDSKASLCTALAGFAHATGALLVAEGVETAAEARTVGELGADQVQGYYFGRPGDLQSFIRMSGTTPAELPRTKPSEMPSPRSDAVSAAAALIGDGASPATIAAALNRQGYATPTGRRWHPISVRRLLLDRRHDA